jgi:hypothetical protein
MAMLSNNGRFLVYAPNRHKRLGVVKPAVAKAAQNLRMKLEVAHTKKLLPIYVYYRSRRDEEDIPIYCDWGKEGTEEDVYRAIRDMMFVLSFHPEHSELRGVRKEN